jgi:hypothetical protein
MGQGAATVVQSRLIYGCIFKDGNTICYKGLPSLVYSLVIKNSNQIILIVKLNSHMMINGSVLPCGRAFPRGFLPIEA